MTIGEYEPGKKADKNFKDLSFEIIGKDISNKTDTMELLKNNRSNKGIKNKDNPEKREIQNAGKQLWKELRAVMKNSDLIKEKSMLQSLSNKNKIKEHRINKRTPLTGEEADELWK
jgi:hypothetical protein